MISMYIAPWWAEQEDEEEEKGQILNKRP